MAVEEGKIGIHGECLLLICVFARKGANKNTARGKKIQKTLCLKKNVPEGSFEYSRICAKPNKNTASCIFIVVSRTTKTQADHDNKTAVT